MTTPKRNVRRSAGCQWPDCVAGASMWMRRGDRMEFLQLCTGHAVRFRDLNDVEAALISDRRQPPYEYGRPRPARVPVLSRAQEQQTGGAS